MFARIVAGVGVCLIAILAIDFFFLRRRARTSPSFFWELAPVLGFVGTVLIALAFVEAARREVVEAWRWGLLLGLVLAIGAGVTHWARREPTVSGWRGWLRLAQTYGIVFLAGVLGVTVAVRVIGALVEVFIASALGMAALGAAVEIFVVSWRKSVKSKQ